MTRFFKVLLRTSDVESARAFYAAVLGGDYVDVVELHEQAIARGARPHWVGFLDVEDVDAAGRAFVDRGATALSPKWVNAEGLEAMTLRDPGGAVVALGRPPADARGAGPLVVWHLLHTADVERAKANYAELFDWRFEAPLDLGSYGVFHPFAWERGGAPTGSMTDVAARPGVHPHWLFHFRVAALGPAVAAVRAGGGTVVERVTLEGGARLAVCDDPQGAAFALHSRG